MALYEGPDGVTYDLAHLDAFEVVINLKIGEEDLQVPLWVVFRNHCYSREVMLGKDGDEEMQWELPPEPGEQYTRLFCPQRWAASHNLVEMVKTVLFEANCYRTTARGLYYKFDRAPRMQAGSAVGAYLFFKFRRNRHNPQGLVLSIESVHNRTNLPANDRNRQRITFKIALKESLQDHYPEVLEAIRAAAKWE